MPIINQNFKINELLFILKTKIWISAYLYQDWDFRKSSCQHTVKYHIDAFMRVRNLTSVLHLIKSIQVNNIRMNTFWQIMIVDKIFLSVQFVKMLFSIQSRDYKNILTEFMRKHLSVFYEICVLEFGRRRTLEKHNLSAHKWIKSIEVNPGFHIMKKSMEDNQC